MSADGACLGRGSFIVAPALCIAKLISGEGGYHSLKGMRFSPLKTFFFSANQVLAADAADSSKHCSGI